VPLSQVLLYELENQRPFAVAAILGTLLPAVGVSATGAIIGVEAVLRQDRLAQAPAVATLVLAALLWGLLLLLGLTS
jgi:membrane protein DedA with SNARE-associated domain